MKAYVDEPFREVLPQDQRKREHERCYWCGAPKQPARLIAHYGDNTIGNANHVLLRLVSVCCNVPESTEHFGTVVDYLCDGWARAQELCRLYNDARGVPSRVVAEQPSRPWEATPLFPTPSPTRD